MEIDKTIILYQELVKICTKGLCVCVCNHVC